MNRAGDLDDRRCALALTDLAALRVQRVPHGPLLQRCWELRSNVTIYDAAYIALAEALSTTLVTADERLGDVPTSHCAIEILR